jgi:hypothetical protein
VLESSSRALNPLPSALLLFPVLMGYQLRNAEHSKTPPVFNTCELICHELRNPALQGPRSIK